MKTAVARPAASWNKESLDGAMLLPPDEVTLLLPPAAVEDEGEEFAALEVPLLLPVEADDDDDDVDVEYTAAMMVLSLPGAGHNVGKFVLHADCVQSADEDAYSEPTFVGLHEFPLQQEQAQLSVLARVLPEASIFHPNKSS